MRRRGEYRPHQDFGVNLSIPWNAGSQEEATWEVASGTAYTTTQGIGHQAAPRAELGWQVPGVTCDLACGAMCGVTCDATCGVTCGANAVKRTLAPLAGTGCRGE